MIYIYCIISNSNYSNGKLCWLDSNCNCYCEPSSGDDQQLVFRKTKDLGSTAIRNFSALLDANKEDSFVIQESPSKPSATTVSLIARAKKTADEVNRAHSSNEFELKVAGIPSGFRGGGVINFI